MKISVLKKIPAAGTNPSYVFNSAPLAPNPLAKLPPGAVKPAGWIKRQLELMANGMTGHLEELSSFLTPDNGWFGGDKEGWEEQPYWFRGFYDMAVLTGDKRCLETSAKWIDAVLQSQDTDGYFGAKYHKEIRGENGQCVCDLWPHMVMLDAVVSHYEISGDARVLPLMTKFFDFCRKLPDSKFMPELLPGFNNWKPDIQRTRAGDMTPLIFWLYNRTGEKWLLDLARRFYRRTTPPSDEWLDRHVVHFTQRFSYPGLFYQLSGDKRHLELTEYWYAQHMGTWGQQPRGAFGADECIRPGKTDPRQAIETCAMAEFVKSFYLLGRVTGDPVYADRAEDILLNHFPAAQTPDLRGLRYLTASNMPQADRDDGKEHDFYNKGFMLPYSPHTHRCCQHNVAMGWPWHAENLWQATADGGLAAWMHGASEVTAKTGSAGQTVSINTETDYPFRSKVSMTVRCGAPAEFPLWLRVPRWCDGFSASLNGKALKIQAAPGTWVRIENNWRGNDHLEMDMPQRLSLTEWPLNGAVTVDRGPLSYSVRIKENWRKIEKSTGSEDWPEWELFPKSPWNYGLVIDKDNPEASLELEEQEMSADQIWSVEMPPVVIRAKAKRIENWRVEKGMVQPLRQSPVRSAAPEETIEMIPLGCARLRVSCLPVIGESPDTNEWTDSKN
jgi:hypothetical protein